MSCIYDLVGADGGGGEWLVSVLVTQMLSHLFHIRCFVYQDRFISFVCLRYFYVFVLFSEFDRVVRDFV